LLVLSMAWLSVRVWSHYHHTFHPFRVPSYTDNEHNHNMPPHKSNKKTSVAFIGNSMFYFNDFPRFFQALSDDSIVQNSCLHGGASISSLLMEGNAMYPQFRTEKAILSNVSSSSSIHARNGNDNASLEQNQAADDEEETPQHVLYDFGACTVPQLLVGRDDRLYDPGYANPVEVDPSIGQANPCRQDPAYLAYSIKVFAPPPPLQPQHQAKLSHRPHRLGHHNAPDDDDDHSAAQAPNENAAEVHKHWDYVVINDNTRNPSQFPARMRALANLERFYVPWLLETGATPVFLWTHAYIPAADGPCLSINNQTNVALSGLVGLDDVANFTSLTRVGYQAYVDLLATYLPLRQSPRIAPVGLVFLAVHEDNLQHWKALFHCDGIHASPSGTFLQGLVMYHTLFGTLPDHDFCVRNDMSVWWQNARMMQHSWEPANPIPDRAMADYLYRMAERVLVHGHVPASFIPYQHGEYAATATPPSSVTTTTIVTTTTTKVQESAVSGALP
jgi:hypothetical protein